MGETDESSSIIARMMNDLLQDDLTGDRSPRCEGCGRRVELTPYELRASNGSAAWVMYCVQCRALADLVEGTQ
jgi:hypothetical protein